jgi:hypothetical protein
MIRERLYRWLRQTVRFRQMAQQPEPLALKPLKEEYMLAAEDETRYLLNQLKAIPGLWEDLCTAANDGKPQCLRRVIDIAQQAGVIENDPSGRRIQVRARRGAGSARGGPKAGASSHAPAAGEAAGPPRSGGGRSAIQAPSPEHSAASSCRSSPVLLDDKRQTGCNWRGTSRKRVSNFLGLGEKGGDGAGLRDRGFARSSAEPFDALPSRG